MHSTCRKELSKMINSLGIPPSSTIMIHSSLLKFGVIENGIEGFYNSIVDSLSGDCTLVMPTFTFEYSGKRYWNAKTSKSEMGVLTEYFRKLEGTVRSIHPFHSDAIYGK